MYTTVVFSLTCLWIVQDIKGKLWQEIGFKQNKQSNTGTYDLAVSIDQQVIIVQTDKIQQIALVLDKRVK